MAPVQVSVLPAAGDGGLDLTGGVLLSMFLVVAGLAFRELAGRRP